MSVVKATSTFGGSPPPQPDNPSAASAQAEAQRIPERRWRSTEGEEQS
jgi:hypothetical protein